MKKFIHNYLHHVGMISGEYLLRELNQNILLPSCQQFVKDYLDTICSLYSDEEIWYRFLELTNTEANCLKGTKGYFDENHPLFGYRGTRRLLACPDEFQAEAHAVTEVYKNNPNPSVIFPFVNDAEPVKNKLLQCCVSMVSLEKLAQWLNYRQRILTWTGYWKRVFQRL